MRRMFDLPDDLVVEEIFSRVPLNSLRSVRSTCKKWNTLSKNRVFGKAAVAAAARKQFAGFMMMDYKVCFMKFHLQGLGNYKNFVIKQVSVLDQIKISYVIHCDGLLLCTIEDDNSRLLVWNPYLGQTRWIQSRTKPDWYERYALGYDKNRNHKILKFCFVYHEGTSSYDVWFEIYDFSSNSWKVLDVTPPDWEIIRPTHNWVVSLKGNAYFCATKRIKVGQEGRKFEENFLLCFDFTTESFGPRLPLPFDTGDSYGVFVSLSCVREEQLAVLYQLFETFGGVEICVTDKINPNAVSWSKFVGFTDLVLGLTDGSFFIDEEKKLAVVFHLDRASRHQHQTAHIIREEEDGYSKSVVYIGDATADPYCLALLVCSSYAPSLVQLQINRQTGLVERKSLSIIPFTILCLFIASCIFFFTKLLIVFCY